MFSSRPVLVVEFGLVAHHRVEDSGELSSESDGGNPSPASRGKSFGPGAPRQVLTNESPNDDWYPLSFSPDGSWLLAQRNSGRIPNLVLIETDWTDEGPWNFRIQVVLNWFDELRQKLAAGQ